MMAVVAEENGKILARHRLATPRGQGSEAVLAALGSVIEAALSDPRRGAGNVAAIGLGVPGHLDPKTGVLFSSPNMDFEGPVTPPITARFGLPTFMGNDASVATLGEQQFGAAKGVDSAVGIFVGTGIGGGVICHGRLVDGVTHAAAEIGHMVMHLDGPFCGCGNRGCLESFASRTAIERDLRAAIAAGRPTQLTEFLGGDLSVIKSGALKRSLAAGDEVVTEVMRRVGEVLGYACRNLRFLLDPEVIILGGGVMEACGGFLLPIIRQVVAEDAYLGPGAADRIVSAKLGDDTGALGAVALARQGEMEGIRRDPPHYPTLSYQETGELLVDGDVRTDDLCLRADGKVKKCKNGDPGGHLITLEEIVRACKGDPEFVAVGTGYQQAAALAPEAEAFLQERGIPHCVAPTPEAVVAYNSAEGRKAALLIAR